MAENKLVQPISSVPISSVKIGNSINSLIYLIVISDPSLKTKIRKFISSKIDKLNYTLEFRGYDITNLDSNLKISNFEELLKITKDAQIPIEEIYVPWQSVILVKNVSYKLKNA